MKKRKSDNKKTVIIFILFITVITTIINLVSSVTSIKDVYYSLMIERDKASYIVLFLGIIVLILILWLAWYFYRSFKLLWIDIDELDDKEKENALKNILELTIYKIDLGEALFEPITSELNEATILLDDSRVNIKEKIKHLHRLYSKATYLNGILLRIDKYEDAVKFGQTIIDIGEKLDSINQHCFFVDIFRRKGKCGKYTSRAKIDQAWNFIKHYRKTNDKGSLSLAINLLQSVEITELNISYKNKYYRHYYMAYYYLQEFAEIEKYKKAMNELCDDLNNKRQKKYFLQDIISRSISSEVEIFVSESEDLLNDQIENQSKKIRLYYDRQYKECRAGYLNALLYMEIDNVVNQRQELNIDSFNEAKKYYQELEKLYKELNDDSRIAKAYFKGGRLYSNAIKANLRDEKKLEFFQKADELFKQSIKLAEENIRIDLIMRARYYRAKLYHEASNKNTENWKELLEYKDSVFGEALTYAEKTKSQSEFNDIKRWASSKSISLMMDSQSVSEKDKLFIQHQLSRLNDYYSIISKQNEKAKVSVLYFFDDSQVLKEIRSSLKSEKLIINENKEVLLEGYNMGVLEPENQVSGSILKYHQWRSGQISFYEFNVPDAEDHKAFQKRLDDVLLNHKNENLLILCSHSIFLYYYYKLRGVGIDNKEYKKINIETSNMATFTCIPNYDKAIFESHATDDMLLDELIL